MRSRASTRSPGEARLRLYRASVGEYSILDPDVPQDDPDVPQDVRIGVRP
jgi:hypothetical protein